MSHCRDVYLLLKPDVHISDFYVRTPLSFEADGTLGSARSGAVLCCACFGICALTRSVCVLLQLAAQCAQPAIHSWHD